MDVRYLVYMSVCTSVCIFVYCFYLCLCIMSVFFLLSVPIYLINSQRESHLFFWLVGLSVFHFSIPSISLIHPLPLPPIQSFSHPLFLSRLLPFSSSHPLPLWPKESVPAGASLRGSLGRPNHQLLRALDHKLTNKTQALAGPVHDYLLRPLAHFTGKDVAGRKT